MQGLATVSKGTAEFLADGERLQPKVLISSFHSKRQAAILHSHGRAIMQWLRSTECLTNSEIISQRRHWLYVLSREKL